MKSIRCCQNCRFGESDYEGFIKCKNLKLIELAIVNKKENGDCEECDWIHDCNGNRGHDTWWGQFHIYDDIENSYVTSWPSNQCEHWEPIIAEPAHKCCTCDQWVRISSYMGDKSDEYDRCHGHCGIQETSMEEFYADYIRKFKADRGIDPDDEVWRDEFILIDSPTNENDSCRFWKQKSDKK